MLRETSQSLDLLMKIRQSVVPVVLDADRRGVVNLDIKTHPCGTPSCFIGHILDVSRREGWYERFAAWEDALWRRDQDLWSGLFGVAVCGSLADRIARLDRMIAHEMAGSRTV
jgi:hypothetical protein